MSQKFINFFALTGKSLGEGILLLLASIAAYSVLGITFDFLYPPLSNLTGALAFFTVTLTIISRNIWLATGQGRVHRAIRIIIILVVIAITLFLLVNLSPGWREFSFVVCVATTAFLRRSGYTSRPTRVVLRLVK